MSNAKSKWGIEMKVGDLVRLTRFGWENTVGVIIECVPPHPANWNSQARVLWASKGTIGICHVEDLEVINESR